MPELIFSQINLKTLGCAIKTSGFMSFNLLICKLKFKKISKKLNSMKEDFAATEKIFSEMEQKLEKLGKDLVQECCGGGTTKSYE